MKVYKCKIKDNCYGGGEAIIAANSALEAYGTLCSASDFYCEWFKFDDVVELEMLTANVEEPTVISCEYHVE